MSAGKRCPCRTVLGRLEPFGRGRRVYGSTSNEPNVERLRSLAAFDHVDGYALAFPQLGDTGAVQRRGMHKNVLAAAVPHDEAEPFIGGVELHRADLLDRGLVGRCIGSLGPRTPRLLLLRGAAGDAQDFRYLRPLGPRTGADLERRARRDTAVPAAFNHTRVQEGITGPIGKLYETEPLVGVVPFDTAWTGEPTGPSNLWALDPGVDPKPRRGVSKLSSSKPRRRVGRKSLSLLLTGVPGSSGILPL